LLLARNTDVTIIDVDAARIQSASKFGFKVYFGDGTRLDVLRASGAASARAIAVCIDNKTQANHIVELIKSEFPQAKILVRSFDRTHSRDLIRMGVDFQMREMFESSISFGEATLREIGVPDDEILEISEDIRRRDKERFELDLAANNDSYTAGRHLMFGNAVQPTPFVEPKRSTKTLSPETAEAIKN
jgi:glutathione-regulated potassium-efflux system protein KefB